MSRPSLPVLKYLLSISMLVGCLPGAMAASAPTLFTMTSGKAEVLAQGAQKSFPIQINEDSAFDAVFQGGLWLPNPAGGRIYAKYQRHILHANGTWTWIGTVSTVHGAQPVVLTFGKGGVFGSVPQASGYPLRLVTRQGQTRVVETSAAAMARSTQAVRLHSAPDYVVPPKLRRKGGGLASTMPSADAAPVQAAAAGSPVTIDVMVAYTAGFVTEVGSQALALTRIQNLIDITNQAYTASGVNQQIRLVNTVQVSYPDNTSNQNALDDLTGIDESGNPVTIPASLQNIASLRVKYGADLVALVRGYDNATQGGCGVGWLIGGNQTPIVSGESNVYGYSVTSDGSNGGYYCLDTTFAHEIGHNMGNAHDRANASEAGAYSYSYGYRSANADGFSTIMAYGLTGQAPLALFSNPNISSCQNSPCGVADSASNSADNAHSMNNTAALIAAFEPTMVGGGGGGGGTGTLPMTASNDVNGDGKSDLLWVNIGASSFGYWAMNGASTLNAWAVSVAPGYRVVATGDFTGDGLLDIVWTSSKNDLYLWSSNGSSFTSQYIGTYSDGDAIVGAGDVDGDGHDDLLFLNTQKNTFGYWLMNGASVTSKWSTPVASGYSIVAIGDFNGDGKVDVVWTSAKRDLYMWESNGTSFDPYYAGTYPAGWAMVGAGDVNGDGLSDLLWRNQGASAFGYWIMNGPTEVQAFAITASSAYQIAATGDFNGDGKVDVMWTSAKDDLYLWTGNGGGFSSQYVGTYPAGWSVIPSQLMAAWGHP